MLAAMNSIAHTIATTDQFASLCKALGDEMRVEILRVLAANSYGVLELAEIFEVTQPRISHHLKILAGAGLVSTRREGNSIFYRRAQLPPQDPFAAFKRGSFACIDRCPMPAQLQTQVEAVHAARAEVSSRFFVDNAPKFRAQQDLIANYSVYAEAIVELLEGSPLPHRLRALEVGPGEGEFLPELCHRFERVTALDNSLTMLNKSRVQAAVCANLDFVHGDTSAVAERDDYACVVANMVLHHTPSPDTIFKDLYPAMSPGGVLLVTELCLHDQSWATEACGDLWLGFDPLDIAHWAEAAGFAAGQSVYFALRNGFQIQLQQFIKP